MGRNCYYCSSSSSDYLIGSFAVNVPFVQTPGEHSTSLTVAMTKKVQVVVMMMWLPVVVFVVAAVVVVVAALVVALQIAWVSS